ncbi:MAG TPA: formyltetrahydrofolate deformylase, partial [Marmoricola sp.]|nr:formyltetrahydrofolate deformylase [Marmoricola sp.]
MSTDPGPPGGPFILTLSCPDRPRIVNEVTGFLVKHSGNIRESQLFVDPDTDHFFMRIMFDLADHHVDANTLRADFEAVAEAFDMTFQLWAARAPHRTLILVSKHLHCLNDLLFRTSTGSLQIEVPAVVSNHPDAADMAASYGVPFHHIPVTPDTKADAEARLLRLVDELDVDLVVLARYMQVLSSDFVARYPRRIINVHHSFLPAFVGAKPYHRAFERGVKLIGATSHYATE